MLLSESFPSYGVVECLKGDENEKWEKSNVLGFCFFLLTSEMTTMMILMKVM